MLAMTTAVSTMCTKTIGRPQHFAIFPIWWSCSDFDTWLSRRGKDVLTHSRVEETNYLQWILVSARFTPWWVIIGNQWLFSVHIWLMVEWWFSLGHLAWVREGQCQVGLLGLQLEAGTPRAPRLLIFHSCLTIPAKKSWQNPVISWKVTLIISYISSHQQLTSFMINLISNAWYLVELSGWVAKQLAVSLVFVITQPPSNVVFLTHFRTKSCSKPSM